MNKIRNKIYLSCFVLLFAVVFFNKLELFHPLDGYGFSRVFKSEDNQLLRITTSSDEKYRVYKKLADISPQFLTAIQLSEDRWFKYHWGVNPISFFRAVTSTYQGRRMGASTITMQLVRMKEQVYTKNLSGKIKQILYALVYETIYSKNQILEAYVNLLPFGSNIEGIGAASLIYFNKETTKLDLAELLTLAVIPQNPISRNLNQTDNKTVNEAKNRLARIWFENHSQDKNLNIEMQLPILANKIKQLPVEALHFSQTLMQRNPFELEFKTSLNLNLQKNFEKTFKNFLKSKSNYGIKNGAVILVENKTSKIKAWIGSGDFFSNEIQGQIDGVVTPRSPGSALKPFVYGLAMDEGLIHPESLLKDTQSYFGGYDPENFDQKYKGPISATEALIQSRNVPAIQLVSQLKKKSLYQLLTQAEVPLPKDEKYYGLSIALGSSEITPEKLAELYSSLSRFGLWQPLTWDSKDRKQKDVRLLTPEASYLTLKMLTENPRTQSYLLDKSLKYKIKMAWKTGTSWGYRDAWTAGVVGPYTIVVWLGNFDYSSNPHLIGRELASPLFFQLVDVLPSYEFQSSPEWANAFGLNLKEVHVCNISGNFPNESCPHQKPTLFIPGVSPIHKCNLHREILISTQSGLRLCDPKGYDFKKEVFEFWPSDLQEFFAKINLQRRSPPPFEKNCLIKKSTADDLGVAPLVVLPKSEIEYVISYQRTGSKDSFPMKAIADSGVQRLTWFANNRLVGQSKPEETLMAPLGPGKYNVMVVDDQGRFAERSLTVKMVQ
jgi:penicillin-binding protein 1C